MILRISDVPLREEQDVSLARQHARRLAALAGLSIFDQTRFATSVAIVARNALQHAGGGNVEFGIERSARKQTVQALVVDRGPGIPNLNQILQGKGRANSGLGLSGARKLVDQFSVDTSPDTGTVVVLAKNVPDDRPPVDNATAQQWSQNLAAEAPLTDLALRDQQRDDLIEALGELRRKESDLKRQLRKIKQLNQKLDVLSLVASKTDNAVIICDKDGYIEWVNDGFTRITGYDPFEVFGKKPGEILQGPETDPATVLRIREKLSRNESFIEEILNYRRDGSTYWVSMNIVPIFDETGQVNRFIAIESDVTRHRRTEAELKSAKDAAETLNRAKSEFLANISHEIRTPMNAIIGMTELCLDTELTPEQRDYLATVHDASNSLLRLLNDILDFSKIEAGKFDIDAVNLSLRSCLDVTMKTLAIRAHEKGIELASHLPADVPDALVGDPARLRQIFVNLVGNAIKFTQQGEVIVRGELQAQSEDAVVLHFTVTDTGIGIPIEQQQQIFDAFTQADSSTKRRFGGTGLGLAITAQLVEKMDGKIWVESRLGSGTTFHFTVRLQRQQGEQSQAHSPPWPGNLADMPVLIVDDNTTNRRILEETLRNWRMKPSTVDSGRRAIEQLEAAAREERMFPLVLLDAMMPDMDGFDVAKRIKESPELARATIMMLSSADRMEDAQRCRELGVARYLNKPISQSDLHDAILTVVGGQFVEADAAATVADLPPPKQSLSILLAEDTPANQKLALRILEKRGHRVTVAGNGREAVETLARQPADLVLMDVQMPEMDGFEATAAIRQRERIGGRHVPIVAMTAHAMSGDRERCLQAGMDDYIAKPLDARQLVEIVEKLCRPRNEPIMRVGVADGSASAMSFQGALKRLEGDVQIFKELAGFFLRDAPGLVTSVQDSIARGDADSLRHSAHRFKGLVSNFDAHEAVELAAKLEFFGRDRQLDLAKPVCGRLEGEVQKLTCALLRFCEEN